MPPQDEGSIGPLDMSDDGRPLLLLDVDGVLNAINRSQNHKTYHIEVIQTSDGLRYIVRLNRKLSGWLDELTDHFLPVWATMWDDDANEHLAPLLGLPSLPVLSCAENGWTCLTKDPGRTLHHKIDVIEVSVGDRPFAWLDDEISEADLEWATERLTPSFLIKVRPDQGLQQHHVDKLIRWAQEIKE